MLSVSTDCLTGCVDKMDKKAVKVKEKKKKAERIVSLELHIMYD